MPVAVGPDTEYTVHFRIATAGCRRGAACPEDLRRVRHKAERHGRLRIKRIRLAIGRREHHESDLIFGKARRVACQPYTFAHSHESLIDAGPLHCVDGSALGCPDPLTACLVDGPYNQADVGIPPEHVRDLTLEFDDVARVVGEQRVMCERGSRKDCERQYGQSLNCAGLVHLATPPNRL